jgi:SOS-response transcriptional repressor LexA
MGNWLSFVMRFSAFNRKQRGRVYMSQKQDLAEAIYSYIEAYIKEYQYSPSMREIADSCGEISLSTVSYHLDGLEAQGRISRSWYKSRSIRLTQGQQDLDEVAEDVYRYIAEYIQREGIAPNQREIAAACHLSKTGVQYQLRHLEAHGRLLLKKGHRRIQLLS